MRAPTLRLVPSRAGTGSEPRGQYGRERESRLGRSDSPHSPREWEEALSSSPDDPPTLEGANDGGAGCVRALKYEGRDCQLWAAKVRIE